ncbi:hypothetical protein H5410_048816 [Solanum commersonii]|uniref:S-protein homolog n=1 Tax=Solanum commersonii TaxID=4109 RepID=A0A9J5XMV1_SOLCO|nr:hypothetical protein H5410_048816 [Solanum commersonii]
MPFNITGEYEVHILNNLPPNTPMLQLHCASADDDFGHQYPDLGKDYSWSFKNNLVGSTLYFCHFWWGFKENVFDVFNDAHYCIHGGDKFVPYDTTKCIYGVQEDGFYFGTENFMGKQNLTKYADWLSS